MFTIRSLFNDLDFGHGMDFHPAVARFGVPDVGAENPNARALLGYVHVGVKVATRGHGVGLRHRVLANRLDNQAAVLHRVVFASQDFADSSRKF